HSFIHIRCNKSVEGSILYIENIERINNRGCYWIDTKSKYVIKIFFVCLYHVKTNGSISMKLERELNSSSSIEGSP
ncbi:hypothetical protein SFRURICE_020512, partial [Spodoptera frugiperda]